MRRPTRLLLWGLGLLLAAVAAVGVFLATLDADVYRRTLERELSAALGRTVSIGSLSIGLSLPVSLSARDLRIANPAWASRPDFVTAASGEVRVGVIALWHGQIALRALHLHDVDMLLEHNADGTGNWTFGDPDRHVALPDFGTVSLTEARIAWLQADGTTTQLQATSVEATIRPDSPFVLQGQVSHAETPMQLGVKADVSLQAALDGKPVQVSIVLEPKDSSLTLDARLASLDSIEDAEVTIALKGERLDAWSGVVGQALPAWGPYRLAFQGRYARSSLQFENLRLSLDRLPMQPSHLGIDAGKGVLGANVDTRLTAEGKLGNAAFTLDASSAPLPDLWRADSELPLMLRATLEQLAVSAEGRVTPNAGVPRLDLALSVEGNAMGPVGALAGTPRRRALPVDLSARLTHDRGGYSARNIRGRILGAKVSGDLAYSSRPRALLTGSLNLDRLDLGQLEGNVLNKAGASDAPIHASSTGAPSWLGQVDTDLTLRVAAIAGLPVTVRNVTARTQWRQGVLGLQDLAATLMDTEVTAAGSVRWTDGRPQVDGSVRVALLDLAKFGTGDAQEKPGSAYDAALPLAPLRTLDADLQFEIDRIAGAAAPIGKVAARAHLQEGKLDVDVASATVADIPLQAQATVDARGNVWRIDASAKAGRIDLEALLRALKQPVPAKGELNDLQIKFAGQGTNVRTLLAQSTLEVHSLPFTLALGQDGTPVSVEQASIEVEPGGPVLARMSGTAQGTPTALRIEGGTLAQLLDSGHAWPLVLQVTLPGAQASLHGTVNKLAAPAGTPLTGKVEIANLAQTAALFTSARLPAMPFNASGQITLGDGELVIDRFIAQAGKSDANGRLRIRWRDRPQVFADLSAGLIDTTQWEAGAANEVSVLDRPISVQGLLAQDVNLHLKAERFIFSSYDLDKLQFDGTLNKGLLEFTTAAAEGNLRGNVRFDVQRDLPGMALRLSLTDVETQTLYTATGPSGGTAPLLSMRVQLAGSGATLREMLGAGQGELLLTAGAGAIPQSAAHGLDKLAGNLLQVLLPGRRTADDSELECAAARFSIAKGIATSSDGIALRLKHVDILGGGAANLESGDILFGYRAVRRELLSLSLLSLTSGFAVVSGTIDNPTVSLDPGGVLIQGGAAWATAGLSLLAGDLWRKLESTTDPCVRIAAGAQSMADPLDALVRALPAATLPKPVPAKP